jgi:hypothetical protein
MMEDVALLQSLKGGSKLWRDAASRYAEAQIDFSAAPKLYDVVDRLAMAVGEDCSTILERLHKLHRVDRLAYELAGPFGRQH